MRGQRPVRRRDRPALTRLAPRTPLAGLDGRGRPWWWLPNLAGLRRMVEAGGFALEQAPLQVRMAPGAGQRHGRLRLAGLRTRAQRRAPVAARRGEPHAALLARPA